METAPCRKGTFRIPAEATVSAGLCCVLALQDYFRITSLTRLPLSGVRSGIPLFKCAAGMDFGAAPPLYPRFKGREPVETGRPIACSTVTHAQNHEMVNTQAGFQRLELLKDFQSFRACPASMEQQRPPRALAQLVVYRGRMNTVQPNGRKKHFQNVSRV